MNYLHKYYLISAELARVWHQNKKARKYYLLAIEHAEKNEYLSEAALAHELLAKFWLELEESELAQINMRKSRQQYQLWGAKAKVQDLELRYSSLLGRVDTASPN